MPSGTVHAISSIIISAAAVGGAIVRPDLAPHLLSLAGGALAGILLTPDLDVDTGSISQRLVRKRAGCLVGGIWSALWAPYGALIGHRSLLSHAPVIGTALRLAYVVLVPLFLWMLASRILPGGILPAPPPAQLAWDWMLGRGWWIVLGLVASDTLHWLLDNII